MKIKGSGIIYSLLCNLPVCLFLTLTSTLIGCTDLQSGILSIDFNQINWGIFFINYGLSYLLANTIGIFVPLSLIGKWFTGLFHVKNDTYTGNAPYRLLATLAISIVYYLGITPVSSLFNYFVFNTFNSIDQLLLNMLMSMPLMLLVGFTSSLISDIFAFKVAHKIDPEF
ncbi:MAG TPA: hypothetical protein DDW20_03690 [Firmicutes bacterium]|nr:hypothetical protein [Bacillota bacterium]